MRKSETLTAAFAVIATVGALALSAWWWIESEIDAAFIEEIDAALRAVNELRAGPGSAAVEDPQVLRAIEEHEVTLDVFAITLSDLRGESSGETQAALARIRDYRQKYPRTTSQPEYDAFVRRALAAVGGRPMSFALNYDDMIILDAEALAEGGIKSAYDELLPALRRHIPSAAPIEERMDNDAPSYSVVCSGREYFIYGGDDQDESWGNATFALFDIINRQLERTQYRFFAINGGNDLGGMFLTVAEAEAAKQSLPRKQDWPYLPKLERPWYGQPH
jgi:hypothetical protein